MLGTSLILKEKIYKIHLYLSGQTLFIRMKLLHGSPGFGIQLTEKEIIKFLSDSKLNLHLGTVDEEDYLMILKVQYLLKLVKTLKRSIT